MVGSERVRSNFHNLARKDGAQVTRLILVRHGETEANVNNIWHGALDAPLTALGKQQVAATARRIAEIDAQMPIDAFFVSPLPRARNTADVIARAIDQEPVVDAGLREFSIGDWEGRSFQELDEQEDLWGRWQEEPNFAPPNGESPASFSRRVSRAFQHLANQYPGATILIVTHGAVISNLLGQWLGEGPQDWERWDAPNCAITVLEQECQRWRPRLVNDVSHLASLDPADPPSTPDAAT